MATLHAEALAVAREGVLLVEAVDLRLGPGETLAITGPSGAGKTSLLLTLAGLLAPAAGRVWLEGGGGQEIALLAQDLLLLPHLSAERNAALARLLAGASAGEALGHARAELDALGLGGLARRKARALSRGQQQRVALARALAHPGRVLLLDEPSTALDSATRDGLLQRLSARAAAGAAVLVATHDEAVLAWARTRLALVDRRLVAA